MAHYLDDYKARVNNHIRTDDTEIEDSDIEDAVQDAVEGYSRIRPRNRRAEITGSGVYDLTLPTDWQDNFSLITEVEYPAGEREPEIVDTREWIIFKTSSTTVLRLLKDTPTATETVRIIYTVPHTLSASASTIPDMDYQAICYLAAAILCLDLSARYTATIDSTLDADTVNWRTKGDEYARLADRFLVQWNTRMGLRFGDAVQAATGKADYDWSFSWDREFLTHAGISR